MNFALARIRSLDRWRGSPFDFSKQYLTLEPVRDPELRSLH